MLFGLLQVVNEGTGMGEGEGRRRVDHACGGVTFANTTAIAYHSDPREKLKFGGMQ